MFNYITVIVLSSLSGRNRSDLHKRTLRIVLYHHRFPYPYLVGSIGNHYGYRVYEDLQIFRGYLFPALYHTLSVHVPVLCLVDRQRTLHARRDLAGSFGCLCIEYSFGLPMPETI